MVQREPFCFLLTCVDSCTFAVIIKYLREKLFSCNQAASNQLTMLSKDNSVIRNPNNGQ